MAILKTADRVKETTTTTGTGIITLLGAISVHQSFNDGIGVGGQCRYCIAGNVDWEVGTGILVTSTTLSRDTILASSNNNALVDFTAGIKDIFVTDPAEDVNPGSMALYIQNTPPALTTNEAKYLWIQTDLGNDGTDCTIWIEDGT